MQEKIPIFYHIPKCGGTYVITKIREIFRGNDIRPGVILVVSDNSKADCEVFIRCFTTKAGTKKVINYEDGCLKEYIDDILFISLTETGIRDREKILKSIDKDIWEFTTLREPFSRSQSMYNYLTSQASSHEPTHNSLKSKTYIDYLENKEYEKNWIFENLQFYEAIHLYDMHFLDNAIADAMSYCYPSIDINKYNTKDVNKNENLHKSEKIKIEDCPKNLVDDFFKHNALDQKIYKYCINQTLQKYKWYHKIQINENHWTPGDIRINTNPDTIKHFDCIDFTDKTVLDIGCRDGLHSFEAEKRGAKSVLGIDTCLSLGSTEFLIPYLESKVCMNEQSVYDIEGQFDIIIFAGVLYHLKYPFVAMEKISQALVEGGRLIIETAIWYNTVDKALLWCPSVKDSPYDHSSVTFFNHKGLQDNLQIFDIYVDEWIPASPNTASISRTTVRCTKRKQNSKELHNYWKGQQHKTWQNT